MRLSHSLLSTPWCAAACKFLSSSSTTYLSTSDKLLSSTMSDRFVNWLALGSWTAAVGYQLASAFVEYNDNWDEIRETLRNRSSAYRRMIDGGIEQNGWKVVIPERWLAKSYAGSLIDSMSVYNPVKMWSTGDPTMDKKKWPPSTNCVFMFLNPSTFDKDVYSIRQYSLIRPEASSTLIKIVRMDENRFTRLGQCYVNWRTIVILFRKNARPSKSRAIFVDLITRKCRQVGIELSRNFGYLFMHGHLKDDPRRGRLLNLSFGGYHIEEEVIGQRFFIHTAQYSLTGLASSTNPPFLAQLSSESIVIPISHWVLTINRGFPIAAVACDAHDVENTDTSVCFTFDDQQWRAESLTRWLERFNATQRGRSITRAANAIEAMDPPSWYRGDPDLSSTTRPFQKMFMRPGADEILLPTDNDGVCRRWINAPSMIRSAAEAVFPARPDLKMSEMSAMTGVDVSDGIPEDGTEDEAETVYLRD